jgi:MATE family multidrug resistance protein
MNNVAIIQHETIRDAGFAPWLAEARALVRLGAPLILTQLAQMAMVTTDTMMVGRLGENALAAATLGSVLYVFTWVFGFGPALAVSPVIAHVLGARPDETDEVRSVIRMGLWAMALLSIPLLCLLLFAKELLLLAGQAEPLAEAAARYVRVLALGLPFSLGFMVLRNFVTALQRPRLPMIIIFLMVALNFLGNYALVFGHFGMPSLGLVGSGVSTAAVNIFSFIVMAAVIVVLPPFRHYRVFADFLTLDREKLAELSRLGLSIGLAVIFETALFNGAALLIGRFGAESLAGHQIALNAAAITFMVPLGIGTAATIRVGLAVGARDSRGVWRAGLTALVLGAGFMSLCGLVFAVFAREVSSLYLPDAKANAGALAFAVVYLRVAAAFQLFDGIQVIGINILRGLKDAKGPMWLAAASYWLVGFPLAVVLGFTFRMGGLGVWIGLAVSLAVAALVMVLRFIHMSRRFHLLMET